MIKKQQLVVMTHNGLFHADEVFAIALLKCIHDVTYIRTRNEEQIQMALKDPLIYVLDVGKDDNEELRNFDHHHKPELNATCALILTHCKRMKWISDAQYDKLEYYSNAISSVDLNGYPAVTGIFHFNALISSLNSLEDGFETAIKVCQNFIWAQWTSIENEKEGKEIWDNGLLVNKYLRITEKYPVGWKQYATKEMFLVCPHQTIEGEFTLHALNPKKCAITGGNAKFMHPGQHFAVYTERFKAIADAYASLIRGGMDV